MNEARGGSLVVNKEKKTSWRKWAIWGAAFVVVAWAGTGYLVTVCIESPVQRGQFGDMFGTVNALFAGLSSLAVFYTLYLQWQAQSRQEREFDEQRFEGTFFRLIGILRNVLANMQSDTGTGKDLLREFSMSVAELVEQAANKEKLSKAKEQVGESDRGRDAARLSHELTLDDNTLSIIIKTETDAYYLRKQSQFSSYFETVLSILRFIDQAPTPIDKNKFVDLFLATLNPNELKALYFWGLSRNEAFDLLSKYSVFRGLIDTGFLAKHPRTLYPKQAFGD